MTLHNFGTDGPSVVLIHGIPGSHRTWLEVATLLADRYRVVVPELVGFGDDDPTADLKAVVQASGLAQSLEEASITRAVIVGHDFGGPIALSLYADQPDLFAGLALLATNAFPDTPIPFPLSTVTWPRIGNAMARMLFSAPALRMMLLAFGSKEMGNPVAVRRIFTDALQNLQERYEAYPDILRRVRVPATVVWGERDPFFPVPQGRRIGDLLTDGVFEVIQGGGHFLPEQRPEEVAAAISRLMERVHQSAPVRQ